MSSQDISHLFKFHNNRKKIHFFPPNYIAIHNNIVPTVQLFSCNFHRHHYRHHHHHRNIFNSNVRIPSGVFFPFVFLPIFGQFFFFLCFVLFHFLSVLDKYIMAQVRHNHKSQPTFLRRLKKTSQQCVFWFDGEWATKPGRTTATTNQPTNNKTCWPKINFIKYHLYIKIMMNENHIKNRSKHNQHHHHHHE